MKTTVWSKQHSQVMKTLADSGRYIAKKEYIVKDLQEHAGLVLEAYDWYVQKRGLMYPKPADVSYPIWVSRSREGVMLPGKDAVILELAVDASLIMPVSISKWGMILNYSYIPKDGPDARRFDRLLADTGATEAKAFLTPFYPQLKREIVASWDRLFDDSIVINNREEYGTLWELKKEWIVRVIASDCTAPSTGRLSPS